jgi:GT2 family glycosyltransferase
VSAEPIELAASTPDPRVGAVILTHNRRDEVMANIGRMLALPERPATVVVDNGSNDGTAEAIARRYPAVRCIRLGSNPGAAGRNAGVGLNDRPYLALCDDDTWWEPGSLRRAADLFDAYPELAVITARVVVEPRGQVASICDELANSPLPRPERLPGAPLLGFLAGASIVRRQAFLEAGGFERHMFIGGEEELLALDLSSAGWRMAYVDDLIVHHHPAPDRDPGPRRRVATRNGLWVAWMRRPLTSAVAHTLRVARQGLGDPYVRSGLIEAARGLTWVLGKRRVVPPRVEQAIRTLEASGAR